MKSFIVKVILTSLLLYGAIYGSEVPLPFPVSGNQEPISAAFLQRIGGEPSLKMGGTNTKTTVKSIGPIKSVFLILLFVYRNAITPVDGPSCRFQPTCSGFALDAVHSHGVSMGILMTGDRLMRCNGFDKSVYNQVGVESRYYDPVP